MIFTEAQQRWAQKSKLKLNSVLLNLSQADRPLYSNNIDSAPSLQSQPALSLPLFLCLCLCHSPLGAKKGKLKQKDRAHVMAVRKRMGRESKKIRGRVDRNERKAQIGATPGSSSVCGGVYLTKKKKHVPLHTSEGTQMDRCIWNLIEWHKAIEGKMCQWANTWGRGEKRIFKAAREISRNAWHLPWRQRVWQRDKANMHTC